MELHLYFLSRDAEYAALWREYADQLPAQRRRPSALNIANLLSWHEWGSRAGKTGWELAATMHTANPRFRVFDRMRINGVAFTCSRLVRQALPLCQTRMNESITWHACARMFC